MRIPTELPSFNNIKLDLHFGRPNATVTGLDIQPGFVAAAQARVNGSVVAEEGRDDGARGRRRARRRGHRRRRPAEVLRELFRESGLAKRVRVGIANQRTVLRTLELRR